MLLMLTDTKAISLFYFPCTFCLSFPLVYFPSLSSYSNPLVIILAILITKFYYAWRKKIFLKGLTIFMSLLVSRYIKDLVFHTTFFNILYTSQFSQWGPNMFISCHSILTHTPNRLHQEKWFSAFTLDCWS